MSFSVVGFTFLLISSFSFADEPRLPPAHVVTSCIGCHGIDGKPMKKEWPVLAGQNKEYLITQIKAFRSGARKNQAMNKITQDLSDARIEKIAEYYSKLNVN